AALVEAPSRRVQPPLRVRAECRDEVPVFLGPCNQRRQGEAQRREAGPVWPERGGKGRRTEPGTGQGGRKTGRRVEAAENLAQRRSFADVRNALRRHADASFGVRPGSVRS